MKHSWNGDRKRNDLILLGVVVLAALAVAARSYLPKTPQAIAMGSQTESSEALASGRQLAGAGEFGPAFAALRQALDAARTTPERAEAGLAIGELLAERARHDAAQQALPARQYLRAALALEARPAFRLRALRALLAVAVLQKAPADILAACADLAQAQPPESEKPGLILQQLDAGMELFGLRQLSALMKEGLAYKAHPEYGPEFTFRKGLFGEQMLKRRDLFDAFRASIAAARPAGKADDEAKLRGSLVSYALRQFGAAAEKGSGATAEAARFHAAMVLILGGQHAEASRRLEGILRGESQAFHREALLALIEIERGREGSEALQSHVSRYVADYGWDAAIEGDFLHMTDVLQNAGQGAAALAFIEKHMDGKVSPELAPRLLARMGDLALELREYDTAESCYSRLLALPGAGEYHAASLLARGSICVERGDPAGGRAELFQYLNAHPFDRKNTEAAIALLKSLRAGAGGDSIEVAAAAIAMAGRTVDGGQAAALLALAGGVLEALDLPELAQPYYRRIALLRRAETPGTTPKRDDLAQAQLSQTRCLLALGRRVEADQLLRGLCSDPAPSPLRSEAACLWAEIAMEGGQWRECERRLALADDAAADAAVAWRIRRNRLMVDIGAAVGTNLLVNARLAEVGGPVVARDVPLMSEVYQRCLARLAAEGDATNLRLVIEAARAGAVPVPLDAFRLQAARTFLSRGDLPAAAEWLKEDGEDLSAMIDGVRSSGDTMRRCL